MQADVDTSSQFDKLAVHDMVIQRLRALVVCDEPTCSGERSLPVTFVAAQQEPIVGRLEVLATNTGN